MVDAVGLVLTFGAVAFAVIVPFVVVPEIMERRGRNPRSGTVRFFVWATFFAIVFTPAVAVGYLFTIANPVEWLLLGVGLTVAILYDYYRLNPTKVPWARRAE